MSLPETCIRRPVMTTLLMMAFVIFGLFSYRLLPVAALPRGAFCGCAETAEAKSRAMLRQAAIGRHSTMR